MAPNPSAKRRTNQKKSIEFGHDQPSLRLYDPGPLPLELTLLDSCHRQPRRQDVALELDHPMPGNAQEGRSRAAEQLWDAYMRRLIGLARARLGGSSRRAADEEDVALSAFDSFYRRAEAGQFARLSDRDDLWQVLVIITERKAIDLMRREGRKVRGEGRVVSLAAAEPPGSPTRAPRPSSPRASPTSSAGSWNRSATTRSAASPWPRMEGYTNREIAERLGCIEQTVERKLRSIRRIWTGRDVP